MIGPLNILVIIRQPIQKKEILEKRKRPKRKKEKNRHKMYINKKASQGREDPFITFENKGINATSSLAFKTLTHSFLFSARLPDSLTYHPEGLTRSMA